MCEDLAHRRVNLNSILEACESQHKASILPPPAKVIRQLVEGVFHESVSLDIHLQFPLVCKHFSLPTDQCVCQNSEVHRVIIHIKAKKRNELIVNISDVLFLRRTRSLCMMVTFL